MNISRRAKWREFPVPFQIVWSLLDRLVPDLSRESHESEFQQLMDSVELVRVDSDTQLTEAGEGYLNSIYD